MNRAKCKLIEAHFYEKVLLAGLFRIFSGRILFLNANWIMGNKMVRSFLGKIKFADPG